MQHETARELIRDWVAEGLEDADRAALEEHLAGCSACREVLVSYRTLWADVGAAAAPRTSAAARAGIAAAIEEARREAKGGVAPPAGSPAVGPAERVAWSRTALQAAAALVIFLAGMAAGTQWPDGRAPVSGPAGTTGAGPAPAADTVAADSAALPTFLVLMRGDSDQPTPDALNEWLGPFLDAGVVIDGRQLVQTESAWYGPAPDPFGVGGVFELFGYMIIQADDLEHAQEFVRSAPHIGRTGAVEVWPIR